LHTTCQNIRMVYIKISTRGMKRICFIWGLLLLSWRGIHKKECFWGSLS